MHPRPEDGAKYNGVTPSVVVLQKILRKFLLEKNEKGQQFLVFIKASFQGYWPKVS